MGEAELVDEFDEPRNYANGGDSVAKNLPDLPEDDAERDSEEGKNGRIPRPSRK